MQQLLVVSCTLHQSASSVVHTIFLNRVGWERRCLHTAYARLQGLDAVAGNAAAQGLIHLGSFYVNSSTSTATPGAFNSGDMQHSNGSGSGEKSLTKQHPNGSGSSGLYSGLASYRPAPRTAYMASRLYGMSGSQVGLDFGCLGTSKLRSR